MMRVMPMLQGTIAMAACLGMSPATAQTASPAVPVATIDPSLIPGFRAAMLASRAEAQAQTDKRRAIQRESDERMAEKERWQAQIADVDKAKALYQQAMAAHHAEDLDHYAQFQAHEALRASVNTHDHGQVATFNARMEQLNAWQYNLTAERARLDQAKADYLQRYDTINKQIAALSERLASLEKDYEQASHAEMLARSKAYTIERYLTAHGISPDGP